METGGWRVRCEKTKILLSFIISGIDEFKDVNVRISVFLETRRSGTERP